MAQDLKQSIVDHLREAGDSVPASDLARRFLRLVSPNGADRLVRSILSTEPRCQEINPGHWSYQEPQEEAWFPGSVAVIEVARGHERTPWLWRMMLAPVTAEGPGPSWTGTLRSPDTVEKLRMIESGPLYTPYSARVQRWLESAEKILAIPEISSPIYDLRDAFRWLCDKQKRPRPEPMILKSPSMWPAALGSSQPLPDGLSGELAGAVALLETCAETTSDRKSFKRFAESGEGRGKPVDFGSFNFSAADLNRLPETPGVYRFINKADEIVYVGKTRNLRQRVGQYFKPLTDNSKRRQSFLEEIRDLSWTPLESELAALVLESTEIRRRRPRWNIQIETHDVEAGDPGTRIFAIPSALHPDRYETYFLTARGAARLLTGEGDGLGLKEEDLAAALKSYFSSGGEEASPHLAILDPQEAILVRRWYQTQMDDLIKLNLDHFSTWQSAAQAFQSALAGGEKGGAWIRESPVLPPGTGVGGISGAPSGGGGCR
ncbi:MAG: GIY-YIG nuclease family protein [Candidatus Eisenbacteria bacterium]|uniref:GIY-YIG nuclease family protein n=1 Tax=Eiseniibacteriota bacterium TaxID=2212470 RepID=A0A948RXJ3_UNCEI|nr:GIY-YIG nuclease family protein [Candidatus Eisenbacteria bacterium]MBU1947738.1 GIY-YIG nuclease family protein [Candidatus Eisenbacteria bacterium]MBU2691801.1 GIY-YIG nuclease family protein [Candidatus Eisenbacteria bacterium]